MENDHAARTSRDASVQYNSFPRALPALGIRHASGASFVSQGRFHQHASDTHTEVLLLIQTVSTCQQSSTYVHKTWIRSTRKLI